MDLLSKDSDMADLFLSQPTPSCEHEEVELILEGYKDDLQDLHLKIVGLLVQVLILLILYVRSEVKRCKKAQNFPVRI
jgi:hypothetical protein